MVLTAQHVRLQQEMKLSFTVLNNQSTCTVCVANRKSRHNILKSESAFPNKDLCIRNSCFHSPIMNSSNGNYRYCNTCDCFNHDHKERIYSYCLLHYLKLAKLFTECFVKKRIVFSCERRGSSAFSYVDGCVATGIHNSLSDWGGRRKVCCITSFIVYTNAYSYPNLIYTFNLDS